MPPWGPTCAGPAPRRAALVVQEAVARPAPARIFLPALNRAPTSGSTSAFAVARLIALSSRLARDLWHVTYKVEDDDWTFPKAPRPVMAVQAILPR